MERNSCNLERHRRQNENQREGCGTEDGFAAMVLYMAAYLFMNLGAFACIILFSIRTGSDRISDYAGLYQKDPLITLGLSLCLLSLGGIPPMLGFFGKIYLFFAGWADHQYLLVVVGLITSVACLLYTSDAADE